MPIAALSEVPEQRARQVAGGAFGRAVARALLPPRLHLAALALCSCTREQAAALRSALPLQLSFAARTGSRSQAPGSRHRVPRRAPYLGTEPPASSPCPLHRSRRRPRPRPRQMDRFLAPLLPARQGSQPRVPRQVRRRTEATLRAGQASVSRLTTVSGRARLLLQFSPPTLPAGLGRIRQATLRRRRPCSQLPGSLHPSRRHLQPSACGLRKRPRLLSLARLCPRRQEEGHDALSR